MKKELFFILVLSIIATQSQLISAKIICSDNSIPETDIDEINIDSAKRINGLGIAVVETDEINVLRRITADLLVDAVSVSVSNVSSIEIELLIEDYTISLNNATETTAEITIDDDSEEVTTKEKDTVKGLTVVLTKVEISSEPKAYLLIGSEETSLSNDQNPTEEITIKDQTFIVELVSASNSNAIIKVYKCKSGEISEIGETKTNTAQENTNETTLNITTNTTSNKTFEENIINQTQSNNTTENNETTTNQPIKKPGFFRRIWNWLKGWFD